MRNFPKGPEFSKILGSGLSPETELSGFRIFSKVYDILECSSL